jgi:beta-glucanase (GH16 family)
LLDSGYQLVWGDNFAGPAGSRPNPNNWKYATPATPNDGEVQQYTTSTSNAQLNGQGVLWIIPQKSSSGHWTSARLETVPTFQSKVGYKMMIEASIRMGVNTPTQQQGMWPAFWALGASFRANPATPWPTCGEWDIYEAKDGQGTVYQTLHCGTYPGGICNEPVGKSVHAAYTPTNFNTYRMVIDRKST